MPSAAPVIIAAMIVRCSSDFGLGFVAADGQGSVFRNLTIVPTSYPQNFKLTCLPPTSCLLHLADPLDPHPS